MIKEYLEAYEILCKHSLSSVDKNKFILLRRKYLLNASAGEGMVKVAFDTRRINQDTTYIPRRNLQNYHRSEAFVDKDSSDKIKLFFKVKTAVDHIKSDFLGDPEWLDSYVRVLSAAVDRTLRVDQKDFDFSKPQLDYLEELLYLRYRLRPEDLSTLSEQEIRNVVLSRDDRLINKAFYSNYQSNNLQSKGDYSDPPMRTTNETIIKSNDSLVDKLFGDVKASKENKEVERSVVITIKDKIIEPITKQSDKTDEEIKKESEANIDDKTKITPMPSSQQS